MSLFRSSCLSALLVLGLVACSDKAPGDSVPAPKAVSVDATTPEPATENNETVPQAVLEAIGNNHPDLAAIPYKVNLVPKTGQDGPQLYEVVSSMGVLYTDSSAKWLMAGVMYYGQGFSPDGQPGVVPYTRRPAIQMMLASLGKEVSSEDINPEVIQSLLSGDMSGRQMFDSLPMNMGFSTKIGNGTNKVALFEDPDCPYCQQFHQDLAAAIASGSLAGLDVELVTFPYVISDRHPNAQNRARSIACAPDPSQAWSKWMQATAQATVVDGKRDLDQLWELWYPHNAPAGGNCARAALVDAWQQAGVQMGFVATPTFLFADGTTHEGLLSPFDLREMITVSAKNRAAQPMSAGGPLASGTSASTQAAAALRDLTETVSNQDQADSPVPDPTPSN